MTPEVPSDAGLSGRADHSAGHAWWAVAVLAVFQICSMIDRTVVAVLIPEIKPALGLNDFQISLIQGMAFALFYGAVGLLIGGLIDRYSRRRIMFGGIIIWSLAASATGLARNYAQLFAGRLMVGFGEGAISPAAQSLLSGLFPRHRLSTPMSCFTAAGVVGISLSYLLGGVLLEQFTAAPIGGPLAGLEPWRQVLIVTGLPGLAVAFLAFTIREPARSMARAQMATWGAFFGFLRRDARLMGGMLIGYGLSAMLVQGAMNWAPTYLRRVLEIGAGDVGRMMSLAAAIGGIAGGLGLGMLIDRIFARGRRDIALSLFIIMSLAIPPVTAAAFLAGDATLLFLALTLLMLTVGASFGPALAAIQMIAPPEMRGRFAALAVLVANVGGFAFGPMLVGAITDYGFGDPGRVGQSIALTLVLLGPLSALAIWRARPVFLARLNAPL